MIVQNHLRELAGLLTDAAQRINETVQILDSDDLSPSERTLKVGQLLLVLDVMLLANRKRFEEIRKELRDESKNQG